MIFRYRDKNIFSRQLPNKSVAVLYTDASKNAGAGITNCGKFLKQIFFDEDQRKCHINTLEFLAATESLESGNLQCLYKCLKVMIDNKVVLSWIEKRCVPDNVSIF